MDWRERDYYLVTISYQTYEMRMRYYKIATESLKVHKPYNHIKNNKKEKGSIEDHYWQMMLSCRKEDSDSLEYELRKATRMDNSYGYYGSHFIKLSKYICGQ